MSIIETFPNLIGFYVVTPEGRLGFYDENKNFVLDAKLTKAFADHNARYLMAYLQNRERGNFHLAIIHRTREKRPWNSETLLLEKPIVRRLYPVTGMTIAANLTMFQKKNREKSIYRGIEIFLEYQDRSTPNMPVYCPVLYDRKTTLNDYAAILDRPLTPADRGAPVVEVINLMACIPVGRRFAPEIGILKENIYRGIVKKGMRKSAEFTLIEDIRRHAPPGLKAENAHPDDPYADIDGRAERRVTLNTLAGRKAAPGDRALIQNISLSLIGKPEPADPVMFKNFARFRDLDYDKLEALAEKSLVYKVPPATKLLERGTNDTWNLYLLDGTVRLVAADGVTKYIKGGTDKAANPISYLKPRIYSVTAFTKVAFLWIDNRLVDEIMPGTSLPSRRDATA